MIPAAGWTLEDVPWESFDSARVNPDILRVVKAAAMVEFNAPDYVSYLCAIFVGQPGIDEKIRQWGSEERQHGAALSRWAALADPDFDFPRRFEQFRAGYQIPDVDESTRGSHAGEMLARCVVESGTSSFYAAIADATDEPVLKHICAHIAADEFRHYQLFHQLFRRFETDLPSKLARVKIALTRVSEAGDDELAYAFYAANADQNGTTPYDRKKFARAYMRCALGLYRKKHTDRLVSMIAHPVGLPAGSMKMRLAKSIAWKWMQVRQKHLARAA